MTSAGPAVRRDLAVPAALVVIAAVTAAIGAPGWLAGPLTAIAAAATIERVVRRPDRPVLDTVVRAAGGLLLVLVGLGFLLNVVPGGLTRVSWAIAVGVAGIAALASCLRRPAPPALRLVATDRTPTVLAWYGLAALVLGAAFTVTVRATDRSERPPLALSVARSGAATAQLAITAGTAGGSYDLLVGDGVPADAVKVPIIVAAGESVLHTVVLPAGQRVTVSLVAAGSSEPLRSLVLQGAGPLTPSAPPTSLTPTPSAPTPSAPTPSAPTPSAPAASAPAPTQPAPTTPVSPAPQSTTPPPVLGSASPLSTVPLGP